MSKGEGIKFVPITRHSQDDFNIEMNGTVVGTFFWKRNHPKPGDRVATVKDLKGRIAIVQNEQQALENLVAWAKQDREDAKAL